MRLSVPIHRLKREARLMSRDRGIPLHLALDRIAQREGFRAWSLLVARLGGQGGTMLSRLDPGQLVLLGARPGQGKTVMGLELAIAAVRAGRRGAFFTLEWTAARVAADEARDPGTAFMGDKGLAADRAAVRAVLCTPLLAYRWPDWTPLEPVGEAWVPKSPPEPVCIGPVAPKPDTAQ